MSHTRKRSFFGSIDPAFLLGLAGTVGFYCIVNQPPLRGTLLHHYTTEHAVEYVIVALFMWAIADLLFKLLAFPGELLALRHDWLPPRQGRDSIATAATMLQELRARPARLRHSRVGTRLEHALAYVADRGSVEGFREYLKYLAEQDDEQTHANYTVMRFVASVAPILGLLGTVVHFGTALGGLSFEHLDNELQTVVREMGTAFNTTTGAMTTAITTLFSMFVCERIERSIVRAADRLAERELLHRFDADDPSVAPFLSGVQSAHEQALRTIAATLQGLIGTWTETLEALFQRFDTRQQLESQAWHRALEVLQERHQAHDATREDRLREALALINSSQDSHLARIQSLLEQAIAARDDFAGIVETFRGIAAGEGKLIELQGALAENLRVLHQTQQIDEALHGLTAAIHILTARQQSVTARAAA